MPRFPIIDILFSATPDQLQMVKSDMFNTELAQLVYDYPELTEIIDNDTLEYQKVGKKKWKKFKDAVISHPATSVTLKKYLQETK